MFYVEEYKLNSLGHAIINMVATRYGPFPSTKAGEQKLRSIGAKPGRFPAVIIAEDRPGDYEGWVITAHERPVRMFNVVASIMLTPDKLCRAEPVHILVPCCYYVPDRDVEELLVPVVQLYLQTQGYGAEIRPAMDNTILNGYIGLYTDDPKAAVKGEAMMRELYEVYELHIKTP